MKYFALVILALAFTIAGCASKQTTGTTTTNTNLAAPAAPPAQPAALSPKEVLKALNKASKEKDVAGIQKQLSQGTLAMLNETAKNQEQTVEEVLTEDGGAPFLQLPEMREEKIDGDKATVEVQNVITKGYEIIPFVKENGEWKAALDLYVEDLKKRATEDMNAPSSKSTSGKK